MNAQLAPNGKEKVTVELVGLDSNAFAILGRCSKAMRQAGWGTTEIRDFQAQATSGDYHHLLATVMEYCQDMSEEEDEDDYYEPYYSRADEQADIANAAYWDEVARNQ